LKREEAGRGVELVGNSLDKSRNEKRNARGKDEGHQVKINRGMCGEDEKVVEGKRSRNGGGESARGSRADNGFSNFGKVGETRKRLKNSGAIAKTRKGGNGERFNKIDVAYQGAKYSCLKTKKTGVGGQSWETAYRIFGMGQCE